MLVYFLHFAIISFCLMLYTAFYTKSLIEIDRWIGKLAVVTGASAGIGEAIVKKLVGHGMKVVGCARNEEKLKQIASEINGKCQGEMFPFKCDVKEISQIQDLFKFVKEKFGTTHVMINNAGIAFDIPLISTKPEEMKATLDVNVLATTVCMREAVQIMQGSGVDNGHVVNMCSLAGHKTGYIAMYTGTKYAIRAITECMRMELRQAKSHIRFTSVSPGYVETSFAPTMYSNEPGRADALYNSMKCLQPNDIADGIIYALSAPPHVDVNEIILRPVEQQF
uniref:dehydrogenase/reductase SDR family member 11-like isoform X1 n=1 Tax=Ciona intestinalis TaxID=7719 RepID=UPI00089DC5C6|nr:dehydrogenase/reductase SDR family member 11-like isoform X1 [Ciona intestinalis]|eukprot:XP_018669275.1 dehydrogenase/reductase SDR family member 11-like isoform X1 [Ciona intestinalis]